jgi:hypothetical protein
VTSCVVKQLHNLCIDSLILKWAFLCCYVLTAGITSRTIHNAPRHLTLGRHGGDLPPPGACPFPRLLLPRCRRRTRRAKPWRQQRWREPLPCAVGVDHQPAAACFAMVAPAALPRELTVSAVRRCWWRPPAWWTRPC